MNTIIQYTFMIQSKSNPGLIQDVAYIYVILHCNHLTILSNASAENDEHDEVVAVEIFIHVGNTLAKSWVCLPILRSL